MLDGVQILIIVNARGADVAGRRGEPAFTPGEVEVVSEWVESGGSLLLVADHAPFGSATADLAESFGVGMSNMDTVDSEYHDSVTGNAGFLLFSEKNGLLRPHPIVEGRAGRERVTRIMTFNGQSLQRPAASMPILALSGTARDLLPDGSEVSVEDRVQGVALERGDGRVVVLGEAAMLTAQIGHVPFQEPIVAGMTRPDVDNKQFTLNVVHWLSGVIGKRPPS